MTKLDILTQTRTYIVDNFLYARPGFQLRDDDNLLSAGVLDSMAAMELVAFAEREFAISVDDEDITEENFGTIESIASYVLTRRLAAQVATAQ